MSVDNITLGLLSLLEVIQTYLNDNGWNKEYTIALAGDPKVWKKEIVAEVTNSRTQIGLPLITIETGTISTDQIELGGADKDRVIVTVVVTAKDDNQLRTLSNLIRRKLTSLSFTISNYTITSRPSVGIGELSDVILEDVSFWDAENIANRHVALIHMVLQLDADDFI